LSGRAWVAEVSKPEVAEVVEVEVDAEVVEVLKVEVMGEVWLRYSRSR